MEPSAPNVTCIQRCSDAVPTAEPHAEDAPEEDDLPLTLL